MTGVSPVKWREPNEWTKGDGLLQNLQAPRHMEMEAGKAAAAAACVRFCGAALRLFLGLAAFYPHPPHNHPHAVSKTLAAGELERGRSQKPGAPAWLP